MATTASTKTKNALAFEPIERQVDGTVCTVNDAFKNDIGRIVVDEKGKAFTIIKFGVEQIGPFKSLDEAKKELKKDEEYILKQAYAKRVDQKVEKAAAELGRWQKIRQGISLTR